MFRAFTAYEKAISQLLEEHTGRTEIQIGKVNSMAKKLLSASIHVKSESLKEVQAANKLLVNWTVRIDQPRLWIFGPIQLH